MIPSPNPNWSPKASEAVDAKLDALRAELLGALQASWLA